ncbi:MAG: type VI secretion protein [Novosphingobium sp. 63-713]|uniref:VirB4 family type IV secretion/conjugal transfer ATPase n=1 Tax=unclassified Novosphingobium TaxID=2644732 RepID=UPI000964B9BF|nr:MULTISPECIES: VirB4 family type IV secretion/conjugal transfer ATPase [unclassified Novosphingobium]MBN9144233.1 VirB4 family type IV secretion/conjugal transfer ATPase [Novosphingobium sp.]MDR6708434.1 type IV secretion system protein VirB4 [Novosphingobium sp. 1748]OJX94959.1 MAG: type VI secretion protein [Novosphingobium sp. 63-713]
MQFLSAVKAPDYAGEAAAGAHLPYSHLVDDATLALRDGALMQVIRIDGLMFETADGDTLNYRKDMREAMLRAIGSSRFALYHHILRRRVEPELGGAFPDAFSAGLDEAWRERLAARRLYTNDLFITVIRRPARVRRLWSRAQGAEMAGELRALEAAVEQVLAALAPYGARRLGAYDAGHGVCSELLEFLGALFHGDMAPMLLPHGDVGHHLPRARVSFGQDTVQIGHGFGAMVSIKDYPGQTTAGMLDDLLRLPFAMSISQSFAFVDRGESLGRMNRALRRMRAADDEAISLREELTQAKDEVAAGRAGFGEHHLSVQIMGEDQREVDTGVAEVLAALGDLGIVAVREDVGMEPAFWAQFPGNFSYITRRALIGSANFAAFASGHNFPLGRARGNPWGDAVALFETTAAGPYHFNFHADGDLGNFTVIGPSGSGKTVITNFLLAQSRRFAPRIVLFDKDRSGEIFIRAMGGAYEAMRPDRPSGLNPLRLPDTAGNRAFLLDWLGCLVGGLRDAAEMEVMRAAVEANYLAPPELRRLRHFAALLRGGARPTPDDLAARLRPWWGVGEHAWLFDNEGADSLDLTHDVVGIDMTLVLDHPVLRTPLMMALFHLVDAKLDGMPAIIVVDEGWKALDDDIYAGRLRDWLKTIRKRGGILGFVTQNAEDALASRIAGAIVEQTATQIFTANPKARAVDYVDGFGLTLHEFELVRAMPDAARCFLVKQGGESVVLRLAMKNGARWLTVLSGREAHVRRLDAIRAEVGDDPACWLPRLLGDG